MINILKVGDKVRIRPDLNNHTSYGGMYTDSGYNMIHYRGVKAAIIDVRIGKHDGIVRYGLDVDHGCWAWTEEMFSRVMHDIDKDSLLEFLEE